jgi:hypothetical protein
MYVPRMKEKAVDHARLLRKEGKKKDKQHERTG